MRAVTSSGFTFMFLGVVDYPLESEREIYARRAFPFFWARLAFSFTGIIISKKPMNVPGRQTFLFN